MIYNGFMQIFERVVVWLLLSPFEQSVITFVKTKFLNLYNRGCVLCRSCIINIYVFLAGNDIAHMHYVLNTKCQDYNNLLVYVSSRDTLLNNGNDIHQHTQSFIK